MYIMETRRIDRKIRSTIRTSALSGLIWSAFERRFIDEEEIDDPAELNLRMKEFRALPKEEKGSVTDDQMFMMEMLSQLMEQQLDSNEIPEGSLLHGIVGIMALNGHIYHKADFENDSYLQTFFFDEPVTCGDYTLTNIRFFPYKFAMDDAVSFSEDGLLLPQPAAFADTYFAPALRKNEGEEALTLDFIFPYTINTAKPLLSEAKGSVLLLGAGLGYVSFHLSENTEVSHITIVEPDPAYRTLFEQHLLPKFPHPEKITLITDDPQTYLRHMNDGDYDFCFVDCLNETIDLLPYLHARKITDAFQKTKVFYRGEGFFLFLFRSVMTTCLANAYAPLGIDPEAGRDLFPSKVLEFMEQLTSDIRITKDKEIDELMTVDGILKLMDA